MTDKTLEMDSAIGIGLTTPAHAIHIRIGEIEYTCEDINRWAEGDFSGVAIGQERRVTEYLAQIVRTRCD